MSQRFDPDSYRVFAYQTIRGMVWCVEVASNDSGAYYVIAKDYGMVETYPQPLWEYSEPERFAWPTKEEAQAAMHEHRRRNGLAVTRIHQPAI